MVEVKTKRAWGSRLGQSFKGILFGLGLILAAVFVVCWNEGNTLKVAESLQEAEKIHINVPSAPIQPKNDQKVVYFTGPLAVRGYIKDETLGIASKGVKLIRQVEMYQWQEHVKTKTKKNVGGSEEETKIYTYAMTWSKSLIDSKAFQEQTGHQNPALMKLKSADKYASEVKMGDFELPSVLVAQVSGETAVDLGQVNIEKLSARFKKPVHRLESMLYVGKNPDLPEIGDFRITLFEILPQSASVIAQQVENTLQPYMASSGQAVALLSMGIKSPKMMFQEAQNANRAMAWMWRFISFGMMVFGFLLILNPLAVLADVVPFIGNFIGIGTGLLAFLGGVVLWTVTTAIVWFIVRPMMALGLIAAAIAICYGAYSGVQHRKFTQSSQNKPPTQ